MVEGAFALLLDAVGPELAAVQVWAEEVHVAASELVRHPSPVAGRHDRRPGIAVIRAVRREHFVASRDQACHSDRVLVRVGPTVGEEDLLEAIRCVRHDALRGTTARQVRSGRRDGRQHIGLCRDRRRDRRMLVSDVHIHELAREVEVSLTRLVPELGAGAAREHER